VQHNPLIYEETENHKKQGEANEHKKYRHHCPGSAVCSFCGPEYANSGSPAFVLDRIHVQVIDVAGRASYWVYWRLVVGQEKEKKEWVNSSVFCVWFYFLLPFPGFGA